MTKFSLNAKILEKEHQILLLYAEQEYCTMTDAIRKWIRSLEPQLTDRQRAKLQPEE